MMAEFDFCKTITLRQQTCRVKKAVDKAIQSLKFYDDINLLLEQLVVVVVDDIILSSSRLY
jgi:hypothetical protein